MSSRHSSSEDLKLVVRSDADEDGAPHTTTPVSRKALGFAVFALLFVGVCVVTGLFASGAVSLGSAAASTGDAGGVDDTAATSAPTMSVGTLVPTQAPTLVTTGSPTSTPTTSPTGSPTTSPTIDAEVLDFEGLNIREGSTLGLEGSYQGFSFYNTFFQAIDQSSSGNVAVSSYTACKVTSSSAMNAISVTIGLLDTAETGDVTVKVRFSNGTQVTIATEALTHEVMVVVPLNVEDVKEISFAGLKHLVWDDLVYTTLL